MAVYIHRIMTHIIASKYFYVEYENQVLDWLEDQFKGRAAVQFRIVLREAKRVATTTGIGQNSVLYRVLRDMLLAYPAHGVKAAILQKKREVLVWSANKTAAEIHSAWMTYYESYDRTVALTHNLADVTLIVPAQDIRHRRLNARACYSILGPSSQGVLCPRRRVALPVRGLLAVWERRRPRRRTSPRWLR